MSNGGPMLYQCHQPGCHHKGTRQLSNLKEHIFLKHLRPRIVASFPETHELSQIKSLRDLESCKKYAVEEIIEEHYIVGGRLKSRLPKHRGDPEFKEQLVTTLGLKKPEEEEEEEEEEYDDEYEEEPAPNDAPPDMAGSYAHVWRAQQLSPYSSGQCGSPDMTLAFANMWPAADQQQQQRAPYRDVNMYQSHHRARGGASAEMPEFLAGHPPYLQAYGSGSHHAGVNTPPTMLTGMGSGSLFPTPPPPSSSLFQTPPGDIPLSSDPYCGDMVKSEGDSSSNPSQPPPFLPPPYSSPPVDGDSTPMDECRFTQAQQQAVQQPQPQRAQPPVAKQEARAGPPAGMSPRPPTPPSGMLVGGGSGRKSELFDGIAQMPPPPGHSQYLTSSRMVKIEEPAPADGLDETESTLSMCASDTTAMTDAVTDSSSFYNKRKRLRSPASQHLTKNDDPDLQAFFDAVKLPQYLPLFQMQGFDYNTLLTVSNGELVELGVEPMGHRKKILNHIQQVRFSDYTRSTADSPNSIFSDDTEVDLCSISSYVSSILTEEPNVHTFDGMRLSVVKQNLVHFDSRYGEKYGTRVRALNLSHNNLTTITNLEKFVNLKELFLDHNRLDAREGSLDFPFLPTLKTVVVQNNNIPSENLPAFLNLISRRFPNLIHLVLLKNPCCPSPFQEEAEYRDYRMVVIGTLPKLLFLDSSNVEEDERAAAAQRQESGGLNTFHKGIQYIRKSLLTP